MSRVYKFNPISVSPFTIRGQVPGKRGGVHRPCLTSWVAETREQNHRHGEGDHVLHAPNVFSPLQPTHAWERVQLIQRLAVVLEVSYKQQAEGQREGDIQPVEGQREVGNCK